MDILKPYRKRLLAETCLWSAAIGLFGAGAWAVAWMAAERLFGALSHHFLTIHLLLFILSTSMAVWHFWPTDRRIARRLDDVGLSERVSTMVAYRRSDACFAQLQRADTVRALRGVPAKRLRLRVPARILAMDAGLILVCACMMAALPVGARSDGGARAAQALTAEQMRIRQWIDELESQIKDADIDDAARAVLLAQLTELSETMIGADTTLADLAEMTQSAQDLMDQLQTLKLKKDTASELMRVSLLHDLGQAIFEWDAVGVHTAIKQLVSSVTPCADPVCAETLNRLCEALSSVIGRAEAYEKDIQEQAMYDTIRGLSSALREAVRSDAPDARIAEAFSTAEQRLVSLLLGALLDTQAESGADGADGERQGESEDKGDRAAGDDTQAVIEENVLVFSGAYYDLGNVGVGELTGRTQERFEATERLYDPSLAGDGFDPGYEPGAVGADGKARRDVYSGDATPGNTAYGQVFGVYYARFLEGLIADQLPEDVLRELTKYYYGI